MHYPEHAAPLRPPGLAKAMLGLSALAALGLTAVPRAFASTVTVDPNTQFQTIEGFGSSLYGGAQSASGPFFNATFRDLFAHDLGCSIVRTEVYPGQLIASGGSLCSPEVTLGTDISANAAKFSFGDTLNAVPAFVQWLEANALEPSRVKLMASIWSPPHWAKQQADTNLYNGQTMPVCTGGLTVGGTWKDDHFQYNARYIAAFCQAYQNNVGYPLYAISIQNEVSFENPFNSCTLVENNNAIDNARYANCLKAVKDEFSLHPTLTTKIMGPHMANIGPDPSNMWGFNQQMSIIGFVKSHSDTNLKNFMAIYTNNYDANPPNVARCYAAYWNGSANVTGPWGGGTSTASIGADGKESWNSEAGGESPTWPGPLEEADDIQSSLTFGNQSAYVYWQTADGNATVANETLLGSNDFANPTGSKKYSMFKQFSRYIRPGSKRVKMTFSNGTPSNGGSDQWDTTHATTVSAYTHVGDGRVTMVIVNYRTVSDTLTITVPTTPNVTTYNQYRTSQTENFVTLSNLTVSGGTITVTVPASCVVTLTGVASAGVPPVPTGLTATAGNAQVALSWNASSGATAYDVKRSTVSGSGYATISSPTSTSYTNTGLTNGTTYYYVVAAKNASGSSANSTQASATPSGPAPQAQIPNGTITVDGTVDAAWSGATAYSITKVTGTISGSSDCSATWKGLWDSSNLYILADVTDDVKTNDSTAPFDDDCVEFYLDADHNGGTSYDANDRQVGFGWNDTTPSEGAGRSITGVTMSSANPSSTTWRIEAKFPWTVEAFTPASNAIIGVDVHIVDDDNGALREGKLMWNDSTDTAWTNPSVFGSGKLLAPTGSAPPTPTGLSATAGNGQIALSWNASSGATSYHVKRSTVSGSGYSTVSSPTGTSYTNTGLTNGTSYYYVVSAVNSFGESANSGQVRAAPYAAGSGEANLAKAATAPTIDGNNTDAVWSSATSYTVGNIIPTVTNTADLSGSFKAAWDATNLYLLADVTDESLIANLTDPTQGDSVEVYIDADNSKGTTYDADDWQYVFAYGGNVIKEFQHGTAGTNTTGVSYAYVNVTGGYRLELKIPWATVGGTAYSGKAIGLDVTFNDADGVTGRQGKKIWHATVDNLWTNPSLFGVGRDL